jgi:hypothetical protein
MSIPAISLPNIPRKMKDGNVIEARRSGQTIFLFSKKSEQLQILRPLLNTLLVKIQI